MAATGEERISTELVDRWSQYVEPGREASFRQICAQASTSTIASAMQPFFAIWRTSLMCASLERLTSMSLDDHLCSCLKTIIIEDDSETLDPWTWTELPSPSSSYDIWPRSSAGMVSSNGIGIPKLKALLRERRLRPEIIKIRDYQIEDPNLGLCSQNILDRNHIERVPTGALRRGAIGVMTRDIIDGANLAVMTLVIQYTDPPMCRHSTSAPPWSLASPRVHEAIIGLCVERQGQYTGLSILHSASLSLGAEATSYWLEQIGYYAPALQSLKLSVRSPWSTSLDAARVVPKLTNFELSDTAISAETIITILASSKDSLTCIRLRQVRLEEGWTWQELLLFIAKEYRALNSFSLRVLREVAAGVLAIDFRDFSKYDVPEECRSGLELIEMGPTANKRVTKLSYNGPHASIVLDVVSRYGREGIPNNGHISTNTS